MPTISPAGRPLHRMRLLRGPLPVAGPDPDPAPAHRGDAGAWRGSARRAIRRTGICGAALASDFAYEGVATCAGDSMCQTSCPVKIDTGALMKELKAAAHPAWAQAAGRAAARPLRPRGASRPAGSARGVAPAVAPAGGRAAGPADGRAPSGSLPSLVPHLPPGLAAAAPRASPCRLRGGSRTGRAPSSTSRAASRESSARSRARPMVPPRTGGARVAALGRLLTVRYPEGVLGLCCGMPFASKAFSGGRPARPRRRRPRRSGARRERAGTPS